MESSPRAGKLLLRTRHFFESGSFRPWFAGAVVCLPLPGIVLLLSMLVGKWDAFRARKTAIDPD